jgi:hypothetical protein
LPFVFAFWSIEMNAKNIIIFGRGIESKNRIKAFRASDAGKMFPEKTKARKGSKNVST